MRLKPHWQILIALGLAAVFGGVLAIEAVQDTAAARLILGSCHFLGDVFMSALKMVIIPLVVSSIVAGIAGLGGMEGFGRLGMKTVLYFALSSFLAILIGLSVVNLVKPGLVDGEPNAVIKEMFDRKAAELQANPDPKIAAAAARAEGGTKNVLEIFKQMVPPNVVQAAAEGQMLGLIFFSIIFGAAMTRMRGESADVMNHFFQALNDLMISITKGIMLFAPLGVFALIVPVIVETGIAVLLTTLLKFFGVVLAALGIHFLIALPLLLKLLGGVRPARHFAAMKEALLTAFSTASSSATLPITMRCVRDNAGVSRRVTSFVLPLGATVNMDGTALYECVAVIFVAQVAGYSMSFGEQFTVVFLALLTSIGVAGIPSASLVAILIILTSAGIPGVVPEAAMAVLLAVDRLLDMSRTAVNIFSDSCGAVVIARSEGEDGVLAPGKPAVRVG